MIYRLDDNDYLVEIIRKGNKNISVKISDNLTIQVIANSFVTKSYIEKVLDENNSFLRKAIEKKKRELDKRDKFYYLGTEYDIVVAPSFEEVELYGGKLYISDKKLLDKWMINQMKNIFKERLKYNYDLFDENIPFPSLKIRTMKTRWGVCNRKNTTVTLNSELIKHSMDEIDYVVIHELSHLVHFDHSKAFWSVVGKYCPDYKRIRKDMKE